MGMKIDKWRISSDANKNYTIFRFAERYKTPIVQLTVYNVLQGETSHLDIISNEPVIGCFYNFIFPNSAIKRQEEFRTIEEGMHYYDVLLSNKGFDVEDLFNYWDTLSVLYKDRG